MYSIMWYTTHCIATVDENDTVLLTGCRLKTSDDGCDVSWRIDFDLYNITVRIVREHQDESIIVAPSKSSYLFIIIIIIIADIQ